MDILYSQLQVALTPSSTHSNYLLLIDAYSWFTCIYGMHSISSQGVIDAFTSYASDHGFAKAAEYHFINIEKVKADAGTQFLSVEFNEFC